MFYFQTFVSYGVFSAGCLLIIFVIYSFTVEQLLQLPFVFVIFSAAFIELTLHPLRTFLNKSEKLLQNKIFLWTVRIGGMFIIGAYSTQCIEASVILLIIIIIYGFIIEKQNKKFNSRKKKKLRSQELEHVTVDK